MKPKEQKEQSKTLSNHRKEEDQWAELQRRENRRFNYKQKEEKVINVVQIMEKSAMHVI